MKVGSCRLLVGAADGSQFPAARRPEVAFVGRSNVGKSSLINSLLGDPRLARVSGTPGRTQKVQFYLVNEDFFFVDLPGYGYAEAPARVRERLAQLLETYLTERSALRVALLLVDARHEPMAPDVGMAAWLRSRGVPYEVVLTKSDKVPRGKRREARARAAEVLRARDVVVHSSRTGEGRKDLWQIIGRHIGWARSAT